MTSLQTSANNTLLRRRCVVSVSQVFWLHFVQWSMHMPMLIYLNGWNMEFLVGQDCSSEPGVVFEPFTEPNFSPLISAEAIRPHTDTNHQNNKFSSCFLVPKLLPFSSLTFLFWPVTRAETSVTPLCLSCLLTNHSSTKSASAMNSKKPDRNSLLALYDWCCTSRPRQTVQPDGCALERVEVDTPEHTLQRCNSP